MTLENLYKAQKIFINTIQNTNLNAIQNIIMIRKIKRVKIVNTQTKIKMICRSKKRICASLNFKIFYKEIIKKLAVALKMLFKNLREIPG